MTRHAARLAQLEKPVGGGPRHMIVHDPEEDGNMAWVDGKPVLLADAERLYPRDDDGNLWVIIERTDDLFEVLGG